MEVSEEFHNPVALLPGREPLVLTGYEAGWIPDSVWTPSRNQKMVKLLYLFRLLDHLQWRMTNFRKDNV
jgi:hypothetical protein